MNGAAAGPHRELTAAGPHRELTAAGVTGRELRASYARCRALNARHGRTYFLATRLLPPARRPAVHALYGFARHADDIVDGPQPGDTGSTVDGPQPGDTGSTVDGPQPVGGDGADTAGDGATAARLDRLAAGLRDGLRAGHSDHPLLAAVVDTAVRYRIEPELFDRFLDSMRMDLTTTDYPSRTELLRYMHGSAEVIGLQMLPVLGTVVPRAEAAPHAAALGAAFQLTNFLRDVAEDLDRDRVYLPADELAAHDVDRELLRWCRDVGHADPRVREALADQVGRTRELYRRALPGIAMLEPASRPCVATAFRLYSGILDVIAERGYDVFAGRAVVAGSRRLALAGRAAARTAWTRLTGPRVTAPSPLAPPPATPAPGGPRAPRPGPTAPAWGC